MPEFEYNPAEGLWKIEAGQWYPGRLKSAKVRQRERHGRASPVLTLQFDLWVPGADVVERVPAFIVRPHSVWRLMKLARALGRETEYQSGEFDASNYVGSVVHCFTRQLDTCMSVDDFQPVPRDLVTGEPVKRRNPRKPRNPPEVDDDPFAQAPDAEKRYGSFTGLRDTLMED